MSAARHHLSGSRVELADFGCLFWARADVELPARTENAASSLGSATHEAAQVAGETAAERSVDEEELEDALRYTASAGGSFLDIPTTAPSLDTISERWGLSASAREALGELYATWATWWRDYVPEGATVRYEVPYAFDVTTWTARELFGRGPRDYSSAKDSEITCTLDAVIVERDDDGDTARVTVVDLKTGRRRHHPAARHAQLQTGALCVAHALGVDKVSVVLAKILPGSVYVDAADLDVETLDTRALAISRHLAAIPTAQPRPGRHCADCYCPLLASCEGPRALAMTAPSLAAALPVRVETEEQAAAVLGAHKAMQAWLDGMRRAAREWAAAHGGRVRMADGSTMKLVPQTRRTLDVTRVEPVLLRRFGEDMGGLVKLKRSVSVSEVERAAAGLGPQGRKRVEVEARRAMVAEVVSELESTGGLRMSTFDWWESEGPALPEVV